MPSGIRPTVDYAFKRVFGCEENKSVLVDLLNAVLLDSGQTPIRDVQILNPFSLQDADNDRLVILDIKARDESGRETLIEMQMMSASRVSRATDVRTGGALFSVTARR